MPGAFVTKVSPIHMPSCYQATEVGVFWQTNPPNPCKAGKMDFHIPSKSQQAGVEHFALSHCGAWAAATTLGAPLPGTCVLVLSN